MSNQEKRKKVQMAIGHVEELVSSAKLTDDLERDIDAMATRLWNLEYMDLVCAVGTLAAALVLLHKQQNQSNRRGS